MVSVQTVLTKALVKQVVTEGSTRPLSSLKAPVRILLMATTSTSSKCDSWSITKAKNGKGEKEKAGGQGGAVSKQKTRYQKLVYTLRCLKMKRLAVEDVLISYLGPFPLKKIGPNNLRVKDTLSFSHPVRYL